MLTTAQSLFPLFSIGAIMTTIEKNQDQQNATPPREMAIRQVLEIAGRAIIAKRPKLPESHFERRMFALQQKMMAHAILPAALMCVTALLAIGFKSRPLLDTMLVFAIVCELAIIAMMGFSIVGGTPFLWRLRKAPYNPFLTFVRLSSEQELPFVDELARCQKEAVQYVLAQYKQERNAYERRAGMIAGAIDKVGIFPAIAGLVITVSNLSKVSDTTAWGSFFGPLLLAFYVLGLTSVHMTQKMDRVIALLEFSIQTRK
jgi:hypothetical protein